MMQLTPMAQLLLQATADSTTTRIVVENGWLANVASFGQGIVSLLVTIMLVLIVLMLFALKKSLDELTKLVKSSHEPVHAVLTDVRDVTVELRTLAQSVRGPVTRIVETVDVAGARVRAAIERAEDRLERLDALAGVVQDEAEELVVKSASVARGLGVGGAALGAALFGGRNGAKGGRPRRTHARGALAGAGAVEDGEGHDAGPGSEPDTHDGSRATGDAHATPRIRRPRAQGRTESTGRSAADSAAGPRIRPRSRPAS